MVSTVIPYVTGFQTPTDFSMQAVRFAPNVQAAYDEVRDSSDTRWCV